MTACNFSEPRAKRSDGVPETWLPPGSPVAVSALPGACDHSLIQSVPGSWGPPVGIEDLSFVPRGPLWFWKSRICLSHICSGRAGEVLSHLPSARHSRRRVRVSEEGGSYFNPV